MLRDSSGFFARTARIVGVAAVAVAIVTCSDLSTGPSRTAPAADSGLTGVSLAPSFTAEAAQIAAALVDFDIAYDRVRITLVHPPLPDVVLDTTVAFASNAAPLTLDLKVPLHGGNAFFDAVIEFRDAKQALFSGTARRVYRIPTAA